MAATAQGFVLYIHPDTTFNPNHIMPKLSDLVSGLGPRPMEDEEEEESMTEVTFMAPEGFKPPDDARGKREFEQVVSVVDMGDGMLKITKIGGIPLSDMESEEGYEEEMEEETVEEEQPSTASSLSDAIAQERTSRGV